MIAARHLAVRPGSPAFVAVIAAITALTAMSIDINLPAVPATSGALGASLTAAQFTVTFFFFGFALGQLVWGPLSDRFGRRPVLLFGAAGYVLASAGCALAGSMTALLALRVGQGFAAGAGAVLGRAIVRDRFEGAEVARVLSLVMAAFILAPVIAPSVGALLLQLGPWRLIFAFLTLYGTLVLLLAVLFVEESVPEKRADALRPWPLLRAFAAVFTHPQSRRAALVCILIGGALNVYIANASAVFMVGYGMGARQFGLLFAIIALFLAASSLGNARLVTRFALVGVIRGALLVSVATSLVTLLLACTGWGGPWLLALALGCFFVTFGLCMSNGTALALQPHPGITGSASAALGFAQSVVPAAFGSIVAACFDGTARPMTLSFVLLSLASVVVFRAWRRA